MKVLFDKNGWWHPKHGLMGRRGDRGKVYDLPDDIADQLPATAKIITGGEDPEPPKKELRFEGGGKDGRRHGTVH